MVVSVLSCLAATFPQVSGNEQTDYFPLATNKGAATICMDSKDYAVVGIAAQMVADDILF